jgi:PsbP
MSMSVRTQYAFTIGVLHFFALSSVYAEPTKLFRDPSDGVAFNYPAQWEAKQQRTAQYRAVVGDTDAFGGSCMLSTKRNPTLAKYGDMEAIRATTAKDIENGARQSGTVLSILTFEQTTIGNRPAILYVATSSYESLGFKTPLKITAGIVKVGDRLYELGCVAHPKVVDLQRSTFISVIGSLTVR